MVTREQIVSEVMKLVHPKMVPSDKRPTIEELEKILNSEDHPNISLAPDGSFLVEKPNTVGDIADAVMRLIEPEIYRCNICGGEVSFADVQKPTVHVGPGGK